MGTSKTTSETSISCSPGDIERVGKRPLLIVAKAAAVKLALSPRTLWSLTKCNAVPHHRIGRAVRYSPAELEGWISAGCPTAPDSATRVRRSMR